MLPPTAPVAETVALAAAALGLRPDGLVDPAELGGSDRSVVLRCRRTDDGTTVVVKRHVGTDPGDHRSERVGLGIIAGAPRLLGEDPAHRLLVLDDLGEGPTLADLLLGDDAAVAWEGALGWARTLGSSVAATAPQAADAARTLAAAGVEPWHATSAVRDGVARLSALLDPGSAGPPSRALERDLARIERLLVPDAATDVVSPGDTCPDNAVLTPQGWRFLDLEGTSVHHVAFDAAYALLPFATCWCVFDPPAGFTGALLAAFTEGVGRHLPDVVAEPAWSDAVHRASAAWVLATSGWLLAGALEDRPTIGPPGRRAPSYRGLLASRWRWGATHLTVAAPAVAELLSRAAAWADREWADRPDASGLPPYPAFAGGRPDA